MNGGGANEQRPPTREWTLSNGDLVRRLLALTWKYRAGCLKALGLQVLLLLLGLSGLSLAGVGIDYVRGQVLPGSPPVRWPLGLAPPGDWPPMGVLLAVAGGILLLALLRSLLTGISTMALATLVQQNIVVDLRAQVYDKMQRLSFRFFDERASGTLINRVTGDVQSLRMFVDSVVIEAVILVISLATYLAYMLALHPLLTLACLTTLPGLWVVTVRFARIVRPAYLRSSELVDGLVLDLAECIQGIHVVKGFAREPQIEARFRAATRGIREQKQGIFRSISRFRPVMEFLSHANMAILLGYGGTLVIRDELPLGAGLIVFAGLLQRFSGQINSMAEITNSIQQSLTGARRVFEILETPCEIRSPARAVVPAGRLRGHVQFEEVSFGYAPGEPVLQEISFDAPAGSCVAVVGATASGKSTLLSLVPRFYDPVRGRVRLDGIPLSDLDLDVLRRHIGLVFQESFLFSNTVAANIAFGSPGATRAQVEQAATIAAAHDFILRLPKGYDTVLGESGADLSGGQRQRLAIARAVLLNPPVLLLDDPTASVDPQTENEILVALDNAMRGRTTFLVTHRFSSLRRADLILVLDHGRIVQQGTHAELVAVKGPYRRAARLQFDEESGHLLGLAMPGGVL